MHNPLVRDLKLEEYAYIVANISSEFSSPNIIKEKEEAKSDSVYFSRSRDIQSNTDQGKQEIYSIKKATQNKSKDEVVELIRTELQMVEDDIHTCNKMIRAISRMKLASQPNKEGELKYILIKYLKIYKSTDKLMTI